MSGWSELTAHERITRLEGRMGAMERKLAFGELDRSIYEQKPQDDPRDVEAAKAMHGRYEAAFKHIRGSIPWAATEGAWCAWLISEAKRAREESDARARLAYENGQCASARIFYYPDPPKQPWWKP